MHKFTCAIFDMDGTILNSMYYWRNLGRNYLISKGFEIPDDLYQRLEKLSTVQGSEYFHNELGITDPPADILQALREKMLSHYLTDIEPKPGVAAYLKSLKESGVRLCVATATPLWMTRPALEKHDLLKYFDFLVDTESVGMSKSSPRIYDYCVERLQADKKDVAVFEDAVYAIRTAFEAGYYTIAIADSYAQLPEEEIRKISHEYWETFPIK